MRLLNRCENVVLLQAARDNRVEAVGAHITYFFRRNEVNKLNKLDMNGYAPIHYAAKFNRFDIMTKLVGRGEDIVDDDDEDDSRSGERSCSVASSYYIKLI